MESSIIPATSGICWIGSASVVNGLPDGHSNATRRRLAAGSATAGRGLKKSPQRRPHDSLHRRKRVEYPPASGAHLGAAWPDAGCAGNLQLAELVADRRAESVAVLLSSVCRQHQVAASGGVPRGPVATPARPVAGGLGRCPDPPLGLGAGLRGDPSDTAGGGTTAGVCAGTEPGGICVGPLERA